MSFRFDFRNRCYLPLLVVCCVFHDDHLLDRGGEYVVEFLRNPGVFRREWSRFDPRKMSPKVVSMIGSAYTRFPLKDLDDFGENVPTDVERDDFDWLSSGIVEYIRATLLIYFKSEEVLKGAETVQRTRRRLEFVNKLTSGNESLAPCFKSQLPLLNFVANLTDPFILELGECQIPMNTTARDLASTDHMRRTYNNTTMQSATTQTKSSGFANTTAGFNSTKNTDAKLNATYSSPGIKSGMQHSHRSSNFTSAMQSSRSQLNSTRPKKTKAKNTSRSQKFIFNFQSFKYQIQNL